MPPQHGADLNSRAQEQGLRAERLPETIHRDSYTPALLGLLNNVLVWGGSRLWHALHGVGTNEWRIISALGNHPGSTASALCDVLGINKSIASKSVNLLIDRGLIAQLGGKRGARHLYLTDEGVRVHDEILPVALERQRILQSDLSPDEIETLNALLVRMVDNGEALQDYERSLIESSGAGASGTATTRKGAKAAPEG